MKKLLPIIILVLILLFYFFAKNQKQVSPVSPVSPTPVATLPAATTSAVLGQQTKSSNCLIVDAMQDKDCTPGAVFPNVTKDDVCVSGYSSRVRNVSESEKEMVFAEYSISSRPKGAYEVDHLISLELGGSNDIANLWPEAADPRPGFHEKDKVENYLHAQVCMGAISLQQAQNEIANDWLDVYKSISQ
ncbi:MAG TPA: HNH endonuclease signature motif containing protein [Candidatus Saccharimonadales bacterium]|nr:HNH endonuclease signature motif containing protein [Candidatus Saccharimonadales bacterium]